MSESPQVPSAAVAKLGADAGLCEHCAHAKVNVTRRGTAYLRCLRAEWDERLTRYPRLPVQACPGYEDHRRPPSVRTDAEPDA